MTSCAIRSPRWNFTASAVSVLSSVTLISPRYPASTVPGAFTIVIPCFAASPERGCTNAAYPSGSAMATPVGTTARSPGPSSTSTAATRSMPASPGCDRAGSGSSRSSRLMSTSTGSVPGITAPMYLTPRCADSGLADAGWPGPGCAEAGSLPRPYRRPGAPQVGCGPHQGRRGGDRHHRPRDARHHHDDGQHQDDGQRVQADHPAHHERLQQMALQLVLQDEDDHEHDRRDPPLGDRKSTRLNSSHL